MFLRCLQSNLTYTEAESGSVFPKMLNFIDYSTPVKSVKGSTSGPTMVANFLESIYFRKHTAKKMKDSDIAQYIAAAQVLDKQYEDTLEDFYASDDGYVTLENYLKVVKTGNKHISGDIIWCKQTNSLKRYIHKYKCVIVETYLANSFLTSTAKGIFNINTTGNGQIKVKDYTKVFVAFGYDSSGLVVLNSLGPAWGSAGFAKISWNVLNGNVTLPDEGDQRCFIKAAVFKNCFN